MTINRIDPRKIRSALFEDRVNFCMIAIPTALLLVVAVCMATPLAAAIALGALALMASFYWAFPEVAARTAGRFWHVLVERVFTIPASSFIAPSFSPATPPPRFIVPA